VLKKGRLAGGSADYPAFVEGCLNRSNGNRVGVVLQLLGDGSGNPYLPELRF